MFRPTINIINFLGAGWG